MLSSGKYSAKLSFSAFKLYLDKNVSVLWTEPERFAGLRIKELVRLATPDCFIAAFPLVVSFFSESFPNMDSFCKRSIYNFYNRARSRFFNVLFAAVVFFGIVDFNKAKVLPVIVPMRRFVPVIHQADMRLTRCSHSSGGNPALRLRRKHSKPYSLGSSMAL